MKLQAQFEQELNHLGSGGAATVAVDEPPRRITCDIVERNSLAVSFDRLQLATPELAAASVADLERIAKSLSDRLTYLMEPISPIEIDAEECIVQLRSNPPQRDDDGRSYYELLVRRGGQIALVRYRKENGAARRQIPATVTREVLLRQFRELGNAVLLGTSSFWEGVDVKGDALSLVVIDKLPFASPDDPVLSARLEEIRRRGGNPFFEYQLPQAVLALKQGVGRLIRDANDTGVIMLCDPRLMTRAYGRVFIESLPPMPATTSLREAIAFLEQHLPPR